MTVDWAEGGWQPPTGGRIGDCFLVFAFYLGPRLALCRSMLALLPQWDKKSQAQPSTSYARRRWWDSSMATSQASWGETERGKYVYAGQPWKYSPHPDPRETLHVPVFTEDQSCFQGNKDEHTHHFLTDKSWEPVSSRIFSPQLRMAAWLHL